MDRTYLATAYQKPPKHLLMEIATLAHQMPDVIDLSLGDPDLTTPLAIIDAAMTDAKAGHTKYTAASGSAAFLQEIAAFYQKQYGLQFTPSQIHATVGALHGMYLALQVLLNPGDEVIIHEPYFTPYKDQVELAGGKPVFVQTKAAHQFQLQPEVLEAAITSKTKALILNSPNNPTGAVFPKETLAEIARLAKKHQFYILSDEVYEAFCFGQPFHPMAAFAPEHTLTFGSFSKAFAMTGWRIGYLLGPAYVIEAVKLINESITYSAPTISQQAGLYALQHAETLLPPITDTFKERLLYIKKRVDQMPFLTLPTIQGSLYAFIDIEKTGMDGLHFVRYLLKEKNILLIPGQAFGETTGTHHVRLAATQPIPVLKEAFDRMATLTFPPK